MIWYRFNNTTGNLNSMRETITRIQALLPPE
jgi:hypothetical protein